MRAACNPTIKTGGFLPKSIEPGNGREGAYWGGGLRGIAFRWMALLCLGVVLSFFMPGLKSEAAGPLDEIEKERIWIETRADGSLNISYYLEWTVLDSTSEGPLSWVKVGIPNEYVEGLAAKSSSIDKISYYGQGGEYVRLDLDREYVAGETVTLEFSIHQHRMYKMDGGNYQFQFTPGWFDDISVKELTIGWKYDQNTESDMQFSEEIDGYTVTEKNLAPGEKVSVTVYYPQSQYSFQDDYTKKASSPAGIFVVILVLAGILGPLAYAALLFGRRKGARPKDRYEKHRGLGSMYAARRKTGRGHHGRGGGCACACACACAGGGRAGCSRKDFYLGQRYQDK